MSPVKETKARAPRSVILAIVGITVGIALVLLLFVVAIPSLTESGTVEVKLGSETYDAGQAASRASNIASGGPLLFSDVSGGKRDIYLQHIGDDPDTGWFAFDARRPGQSRSCTLVWQPESADFRDPCDATIVPADGTGLTGYPVTITDGGKVIVNLNSDSATQED